MKRKVYSFALVFIICGSYANAQSEKDIKIDEHKNALHASAGIGGMYLTAIVNYEYVLPDFIRDKPIKSYAKLGLGAYAVWDNSGQLFVVEYGMLLGAKKHRMEINAGYNHLINGDLKGLYPIAGGVG